MSHYLRSTLVSLLLHAAVILGLALCGVISGCRLRHQPLEIVEFTIAVDPVAEPEVEEPKPEEVKPPEPPKPDDIAIEKPKPKKPEEKPKKPEEKPKKPKIEKGKRVNRPINSPVKPKEKQTLSDAEIEKWLNKRAKIGERTSLPKNEASLNASILMNSFYEAWNPPPKASSGTRPAIVVFGIAKDGTLLNPRIEVSSGSSVYDESCLKAVRSVGRVAELSQAFIAEYGSRCEVEFKQKE